MKWVRIIAISVTLLVQAATSFASGNGFARISLIQGDVLVKDDDSPEWVPAAINTPIGEGDSIWSPSGSRVEIQLKNGSFLRLDEQSSLDVVTVEDDYLQFHLGMGRLYVKTGEMNDRSMQVDFRDTSVKVYDRSRFRIDLERDGDEEISIFKGAAYVESATGKTKVRAGEMLNLEDGSTELSSLKAPDSWETWNSERDKAFVVRRVETTTYLPEELQPYAPELESNGRWERVPEYGYIWRPTIIERDWAPYTVGRWVWRRGDYVWVSYENWGWAPYHYGRWVHLPYRGWCWVPPARGDVFWSPGYVGWISTPTYVGWVPLAPGETYYGYGNYGRHSINISITNIHVHEKKRTYRNSHIHNAVIVVDKDSFASGKHRRVRPKENIFIKEKVVVVRPEVKHRSREAYMPVIKEVAPTKLPPAVVTKVKVKELKARHPRLRDGDWDEKRDRRGEKIQNAPREEKRQHKSVGTGDVIGTDNSNDTLQPRRSDKEREKELRKEEKERRKEQQRDEERERKEQLKNERRQSKELQRDAEPVRVRQEQRAAEPVRVKPESVQEEQVRPDRRHINDQPRGGEAVRGKQEQPARDAEKVERPARTWDSEAPQPGRRERRDGESAERQSRTAEAPQQVRSEERQPREEKRGKKVWKIKQKEQKENKENKEQKEQVKGDR